MSGSRCCWLIKYSFSPGVASPTALYYCSSVPSARQASVMAFVKKIFGKSDKPGTDYVITTAARLYSQSTERRQGALASSGAPPKCASQK